MLKNIFRTILIVLIAGLIAGGWYAFSLTSASQSLLPDRGEARPVVVSVAQTDVPDPVTSADTTTVAPAPIHEAETGTFSAQVWPGFLEHALLLAAVTGAVLSIRKVIDLAKNWQRNRAATPSDASTAGLERREFLRLGGMVLASGALAVVYKNLTGGSYATASSTGGTTLTQIANMPTTTSPQQQCLTCPKGLTNDPYPGRCDRYVDNDNDGFCDYSVATAACAGAAATAGNIAPVRNNSTPPQPAAPAAASTPTPRCTGCPKGLTNDPYPGRCHLYLDQDNDGFCDYSVATTACASASGQSRPNTRIYEPSEGFNYGRHGHEIGRHGHGNRQH